MMGSFGPLYVGSFSCASGSSVSDPSELLDAALFSDAEDADALSAATRRFAAASSCASVANAAKGSFVRSLHVSPGQFDRSFRAFHRGQLRFIGDVIAPKPRRAQMS